MKIGADNKKKVKWMAALLAVLLVVGVYNFRNFRDLFGGDSAAAPPSISSASPQKKAAIFQDPSQDPRLRLDILEASREVKYEPGRDIFHMHVPIPTPVANGRATPPPIMGPPAPPTPTPFPPIPLKYYGFASRPGEPKKVFLADEQGQRQFVVGQGDIVDRRYRLVQIQASQVLMEDMLTNHREAVPLTPNQLPPR